jgi:Fe-S oxidoreductase
VSKNSAGYNVFDVERGLTKGVVDLPKLFVGSEGTLGIFSEATIQLVSRPRFPVTGLIHFQNLEEMGDAVHELLELQPSALEVMDANTLNLIGRPTHGIPESAAATLLIEFDQDEDQGRGQRLRELCGVYRLSSAPILAFDPEQQVELWKARKALYPTLYRYDQKKKPINFVDDVVVSAERTGQLIRYLEEVFGRQDVRVAIFGHIGNGNAHIVPLLDVNDTEDFKHMVDGYYDIHQAVLDRFDGSICGEHGDGRVRAEMVRRMFGDELYHVFESIKSELDHSGVFNPGVKISDVPFTEHIDFERLSKPCATCAKCNAVCPVYDVFQSEDMSSRGWFEIVTAPDYSYLQSKRVVEACLNCKSCRTVCPAGVDVSELILKRRAEEPNKVAGAVFRMQAHSSFFEPLLKLLARTQSSWDRPTPRKILEKITKPILKKVAETARLPQELELPKLATTHLRDRYAHLVPQGTTPTSNIAYFHGCAANYFDDGVGDAVIHLLGREGLQPDLPRQRCSGTPIETYGHRDLAKEGARVNLQSLDSYETVVTGCASCTLALKDYAAWFEGEPEEGAARQLSQKVKHISEFMAERKPKPSPQGEKKSAGKSIQKVTYHSSCHLRAAGCTKAPRTLLASAPGIEYSEMQDADRCAGGAGTYVVKDYDTSQKIFERKRRAIEQSGAEVVATSCPACMIQLKNGSKGAYQVKHIAQVLNEAYEKDCTDEGTTV